MERLLKEKEQMTPMEVIPLSAVPIAEVSTVEIPSASPLTALEKTVELAKSMEEMNLKETEINRLKREVENLQELKSSFQTRYNVERQATYKIKRKYNNSRNKQCQERH